MDPETHALTPEELDAISSFKVGQPFHSDDAATTIDKLFKTGSYTDIQVAVDAIADGVSVRIITETQKFTGHIAIQGDVGRFPTPQEVIEATRLRLGEPLQEDELRD